MAIDEPNRRLFIACGKSARLVIFDLNRRRVVTTVPIGFGPDCHSRRSVKVRTCMPSTTSTP